MLSGSPPQSQDTPKLHIRPAILASLECAGSRQCNGTSHISIRCMVLEIQLFLIHAFQNVVALHFHELGLHKSRKTPVAQEPHNVQKQVTKKITLTKAAVQCDLTYDDSKLQ